jgi:hypothetical protein
MSQVYCAVVNLPLDRSYAFRKPTEEDPEKQPTFAEAVNYELSRRNRIKAFYAAIEQRIREQEEQEREENKTT